LPQEIFNIVKLGFGEGWQLSVREVYPEKGNITGGIVISEEAKKNIFQCRHYAMCKIDFLGTGLCPSGPRKHYVSYYPQGRMDICNALARDLSP